MILVIIMRLVVIVSKIVDLVILFNVVLIVIVKRDMLVLFHEQ